MVKKMGERITSDPQVSPRWFNRPRLACPEKGTAF